jgi:hypothetical protein
LQNPRNQIVNAGTQVKNPVGLQSEPVDIAKPIRADAPHKGTGDQGVDVAVRKHNEPCFQGWDDLVLEAIGEIGSIKERHRDAT